MSNFGLPRILWEERPTGCSDLVWRYSASPITSRDLIPSSNSIFNSAVVLFQDKFTGVFRCGNRKQEMNIHICFRLKKTMSVLAMYQT